MSQQNTVKVENKMGVMPMSKLIMTMSVPMIISNLVQALYNIVDSIYVARIAEDALTAVSLAFPMQNIMTAVGMGTCVGMNALMSRALGQKNPEEANRVACNSMLLMACSYLVFLLLGVFFVPTYYRMQTDDAEIVEYGIQYLTIVCACSFGFYVQIMFERMLQSTGKTFQTMITQTSGAIINIILDPILIFGYFGFPAMGVRGAAVATVTGQIVAGILAFLFNRIFNTDVPLSLKRFKPSGRVIGNIYRISIPSIIMQGISAVMNFGMNQILLGFTSTAAAVFGVYYKLQSFVFMPVFGMNNAFVPIISYNYGATKRDRVYKAIKLGCVYCEAIMILGFALMQLIPGPMLKLFSASDEMLSLGIPALRIISISFLMAGISIPLGSAFQALGRAVYGMINSICRQVVILLPVAWLLSLSGNVNLVWWAFPIAEVASLLLVLFFFTKMNRELISKIGEPANAQSK